MSEDSDPISINLSDQKSFIELISDMINGIQYKLFTMIFVMFILLSSDMFINRILTKFDGAVEYNSPTGYGTFLQGLLLVLMCIIIDCLIGQHIL